MNQMDDDYIERLVSRTPVKVRRRVLWGECDPAQVVYTPRFLDYPVAALMWFERVVRDAEGRTLAEAGLGTPMKAMALEFHRPLRPDDIFEMTVMVADVRVRTFDLEITARGVAGDVLFVGRMSPIFVDLSSFKSLEIPNEFRNILVRYQDGTRI